jgi:hypothetical protein
LSFLFISLSFLLFFLLNNWSAKALSGSPLSHHFQIFRDALSLFQNFV